MELDLWLDGKHVATVVERRSGRLALTYSEDTVRSWGLEVPLISCSLPTPGPTEPAKTRAYLEGLLPEGELLRTMAGRVGARLLDDAPASLSDLELLLVQYGWECAGAIMVLQHGASPPTRARYQRVTEGELRSLITNLPTAPLGSDPDLGLRMSIGGTQPKLLLAQVEGQWARPLSGAPSTHILKPEMSWPFSSHNEALVMSLAAELGLSSVAPTVEQIGGIPVLVTRRYDRPMLNAQVIRLHQEDVGQALGIRPVEKYSSGRITERTVGLLRNYSLNLEEDLEVLFRQTVFRSIVGDADNHPKNTSLFLCDRGVRVAPLYDAICTLAYRGLSPRMAVAIDAQWSLGKVDEIALVHHGTDMGLSDSRSHELVAEMESGLFDAISNLPAALLAPWPGEELVRLISERLARLRAGLAMGMPTQPIHWPSLADRGIVFDSVGGAGAGT